MPTMTKAGYTPPQPPKQPPQTGGKKKKKRKGRKKQRISAAAVVSTVIFLLACLAGAGAIYVYTETAPYQNTFLPGTMLMGYPLGGASMEQAQELLSRITEEEVSSWTAEMTWDRQSYVLSAADVSLAIDSEATLSGLWQRGRSGGVIGMYLEMLALREEPMIVYPVLTYDMTGADDLLALVYQDIACAPEEATVAYSAGSAEPFVFTTEAIGYSLDLAPVREEIERSITTLDPAVIALEPERSMPQYARADLEAAVVLRSRVVMDVDTQEAAYTNVSLAASALNGARIEAGGTLSFNAAVGARSASAGYLEAQEPAYGEAVSGVGGGVCQLSTALYRAALTGGLTIEERSAAVRPVDYCGMGQEAAVSDQGIDLVIGNPTAYPVFILTRTYMDDERAVLDVQIIGESLPGRRELVSGILEETLIEEPVYVRDHEGKYATYNDERVPAGEAKPGYKVAVDLVEYDAQGGELSRREVSSDEYAPIPPAIYVGLKSRE